MWPSSHSGGFRLGCCALSTTITEPPLAAPSTAGASEAGVPAAPIQKLADALAHPQLPWRNIVSRLLAIRALRENRADPPPP